MTDDCLSIPARVAAKYARGDDGLRQDLESACNVALAEALPAVDERRNPPAYLSALCRWRAGDALRRERLRSGRRRPLLDRPDPEQPDPADALCRRDEAEALLAAMTPAAREAVLLHADGLTSDEIAARLGVPAGTVRTRIHAGRVAARKKIGGGT